MFDLGAKGFQTLFSGLEGEVPALKPTDSAVDFSAEGRCGEGCPTCLPSAPPSLAGSGPSRPRARRGRRRRAAVGLGGPESGRRGRARGDPTGRGARGQRERARLVCERDSAPPARRASPPGRLSSPSPGRTGWIQLTPLPRVPRRRRRRWRRALNERRRVVGSPSASLGGGGGGARGQRVFPSSEVTATAAQVGALAAGRWRSPGRRCGGGKVGARCPPGGAEPRRRRRGEWRRLRRELPAAGPGCSASARGRGGGAGAEGARRRGPGAHLPRRLALGVRRRPWGPPARSLFGAGGESTPPSPSRLVSLPPRVAEAPASARAAQRRRSLPPGERRGDRRASHTPSPAPAAVPPKPGRRAGRLRSAPWPSG